MQAIIAPKGKVQIVTPAGSGDESILLLLVALFVAAVASLVVMARGEYLQTVTLKPHQIDLSTALTPAEQGIYTDLQAVHDELSMLYKTDDALTVPPDTEYWENEGWPPFVTNSATDKRGNHQWQRLSLLNGFAYKGMSSNAELSSHLLWRLPADTKQLLETDFDIWIWKPEASDAQLTPVQSLESAKLIAQGWRQVIAHEKSQQNAMHSIHGHAH